MTTPVTRDEWEAEYRSLRFRPGPSVAELYWRGWLDQVRTQRTVSLRPAGVQYMTPKERIEAMQGYALSPSTQILRCGRRSFYVIEPDRRGETRVRVS